MLPIGEEETLGQHQRHSDWRWESFLLNVGVEVSQIHQHGFSITVYDKSHRTKKQFFRKSSARARTSTLTLTTRCEAFNIKDVSSCSTRLRL